jgi:hypothetical protein
MRRYNYKNHSEIPPYMADYLTDVVGTVETVEEVPLNQINDFLNGLEEWYEDDVEILYSTSAMTMH